MVQTYGWTSQNSKNAICHYCNNFWVSCSCVCSFTRKGYQVGNRSQGFYTAALMVLHTDNAIFNVVLFLFIIHRKASYKILVKPLGWTRFSFSRGMIPFSRGRLSQAATMKENKAGAGANKTWNQSPAKDNKDMKRYNINMSPCSVRNFICTDMKLLWIFNTFLACLNGVLHSR